MKEFDKISISDNSLNSDNNIEENDEKINKLEIFLDYLGSNNKIFNINENNNANNENEIEDIDNMSNESVKSNENVKGNEIKKNANINN